MGNATSSMSFSPFVWTNLEEAAKTDLGFSFKRGIRGLKKKRTPGVKVKRVESNPRPGNVTPQDTRSSTPLPGILRHQQNDLPYLRHGQRSVSMAEVKPSEANTSIPTSANILTTNDSSFNNNNVNHDTMSVLLNEQRANLSEPVPITSPGEGGETLEQPDINRNVYKPFVPEPWPTASMIQTLLAKSQREPTTAIIAKFYPRGLKVPVVIQYSYNRYNQETVFEASDNLYTIIPTRYELSPLGDSHQERLDFFFRTFKYSINTLLGSIWWNGYFLVVDQKTTRRRLKVSGFEPDPSQLLFEIVNVGGLNVHRKTHSTEIRGHTDGNLEETKSFKIKGPNAKDVKVSKLRSNLVTVHVPEYNSEVVVLPVGS
ncbi:hypothetical protein Ocin01_03461 [Orchesella cincta]|uniref:Uncharacterized protein n=1 Tax=Orchesella cincta TaxID=48709 RepID=A0A1D2NDQ2_ORCCI|nr:hypothetical protein Ocin01_03461 [Orchesella cincta]